MNIPLVMQSPLTPQAVLERKIVESFSDSPDFDPSGTWTNQYLIWGWNGLFGPRTPNRPLGYLHVTRRPVSGGVSGGRGQDAASSIELSVEQYMLLEDGDDYGGGYRQKAQARCRADRFCTPMSWNWEQEFFRHGKRQSELFVQESGVFASGRIRRTVGGKQFDTAIRGELALNFGLIDTLQRGGESEGTFTLYEDFSTIKHGQQLIRQEQNRQLDYEYVTQIGYGLISYDFWRDARGRVVLISSNNRLYILCDDPASRVQKEEEINNIYRKPAAALRTTPPTQPAQDP